MISVAETFDYPCVIDDVIGDFVDVCHQVFAGDHLGILLVGSCSRGEMSWAMKKSLPNFYSDIEFIVVVEKNDRRRNVFAEKIAELDEKRDLGDRFKIDYVLNDWSGIARLDKKIFVFDAKSTGIELGDKAVKAIMPDVKKDNLNFSELNDVLLHRMKALVIDVPVDIFVRAEEQDTFCLSIAKNTLDITTWLFPYEADVLVSGFENRLNSWENRRKDLTLSLYFGDAEFNFFWECLAIRRSRLSDLNVISLLKKCLSVYAKAIAYCKAMNNIPQCEKLSKISVSKNLFLEFSLRRRLKEAFLLLINAGIFDCRSLFVNIFTPRKGRQIEFCYSMIEALYLLLMKKNSQYDAMINQSQAKLESLIPLDKTIDLSGAEQWLSLRERYRLINRIVI